MLTDAQKTTLAAALRSSAVPAVVAAVAARDDNALATWLNTATATVAWTPNVSKQDHFEATDVAKFDNLTAGKRDAWVLMQNNAPLDLSRQKNRKATLDVWGAADSVAVLQAFTRFATNGELIFGGADDTTNTVTGKKLNVPGSIFQPEVSDALNRNP
jgi:hypothetical protein